MERAEKWRPPGGRGAGVRGELLRGLPVSASDALLCEGQPRSRLCGEEARGVGGELAGPAAADHCAGRWGRDCRAARTRRLDRGGEEAGRVELCERRGLGSSVQETH